MVCVGVFLETKCGGQLCSFIQICPADLVIIFEMSEYLEKNPDTAIMRYVDTLEVGEKYTLYSLKQRTAGGRPELNLIVYYLDDGINFFSFMPKKYVNKPKTFVDDYLKQIEDGKPPSICFYGKLGLANIVEIHKEGEAVNSALVAKISKLGSVMNKPRGSPVKTPTKGSGQGSGDPLLSTPTKRVAEEDEDGASPHKRSKE